ncbi:BTB/POZ domain-containing protein 2-like [Sitodiplosis mosellana]|uniref:BTB/POZ domain-containing protein 2-like n=1 Tax=Sitodiplosis mosellana TaxID=263140 RepID=UPI0024445305|nr:BTB/POZ domain-containing protein 2-like [Sitodiplosis mosellana]
MESTVPSMLNIAAAEGGARLLYLDANLADVNFVFEGESQKVPANKSILAVLSPVFRAMFYGAIKEKGDVKIVDTNGKTFKAFLQFFYLKNVTVPMESIEDVIRLADYYDIKNHVSECAMLLVNNLSLDDICWGYQLAYFLHNDKLKEYCVKVISAFPLDIFKSNSFHQCNPVILQQILQLDSLNCNESDVFDACLSWAKNYCNQNGMDDSNAQNLKSALGECFELIRFGAMKVDEFTVHAKLYTGMFSDGELADLLFTTTTKDHVSNRFKRESRSKPAFKWHLNDQMICKLENTMSAKSNWLNNNDYTYFSTNCPVLLGEVYFHRLQRQSNGSNEPPRVTMNIKIVEHSDISFELSVGKTTLFNGPISYVKATESKILLNPPLLISPRKMYQITYDGSFSEYYYYESENSEINVNENFTVKFHTPNMAYGEKMGLVSRLYFSHL